LGLIAFFYFPNFHCDLLSIQYREGQALGFEYFCASEAQYLKKTTNTMQKRLLSLVFLLVSLVSVDLTAQNPQSEKTTLLSHWVPSNMPPQLWGYIHFNSCWGHVNPDGREYAILGGTNNIAFVDITNPTQPELIADWPSKDTTVWREFKSYRNRIYAVADNSKYGLQIFDMTQAPDTVKRTYYSEALFLKSHTITLDSVRGVIFLNSSTGCIGLLDVKTNPDVPQWLGSIQLSECSPHDSYYRDNKLYVSNGNAGLYIYDVTNLANPTLLATISTAGYNHSGTTDKTGRYFYYLEEIPAGRPAQIVDLQNLQSGDIELVGSFIDPLLGPTQQNAILHNPFQKDDLLYIGAYEDGLLVYDIKVPTSPKLVAWFDPSNNTEYHDYTGVWSVYPWLPSGNIIVGDMVQGLFIVKVDDSVTSGQKEAINSQELEISPNPAFAHLYLSLPEAGLNSQNLSYKIHNAAGQLVQSNTLTSNTIHVGQLSQGLYYLQVQSEGTMYRSKFVKQ
jgi:choice-of-anchor B domain-containing protein